MDRDTTLQEEEAQRCAQCTQNGVDKDNELLCCPFCGEKDFDLEGLKGHLEHLDCEIYNNTKAPKRIY